MWAGQWVKRGSYPGHKDQNKSWFPYYKLYSSGYLQVVIFLFDLSTNLYYRSKLIPLLHICSHTHNNWLPLLGGSYNKLATRLLQIINAILPWVGCLLQGAKIFSCSERKSTPIKFTNLKCFGLFSILFAPLLDLFEVTSRRRVWHPSIWLRVPWLMKQGFHSLPLLSASILSHIKSRVQGVHQPGHIPKRSYTYKVPTYHYLFGKLAYYWQNRHFFFANVMRVYANDVTGKR